MNPVHEARELEKKIGIYRQWYKLHDQDPVQGAIPIGYDEAIQANQQGYGIFWANNSFNGPRRKDCLTKINAWAIEIDTGDKEEILEKIENHPIYPSLVIETKRGYHVYYHAQNATAEAWDEIVSDRLVPFFKADPKARDLCRILRVPHFNHLKDPLNPFEVRLTRWNRGPYTEEDMRFCFERDEPEEKLIEKKKELRRVFGVEDDLWERVYHLDCEYALEKLSGHRDVGGETFSFRRVSSGNLNVLVNGKSTSCFIDKNKRIGSMDKGGPTIFNWLKWYGLSSFDVVQTLKEVFPELFNGLKR